MKKSNTKKRERPNSWNIIQKQNKIDMKIKTQLTFFDLNEGTKCPQRDKRQAQNPKGEKQTREEANQKGKNKPERREPQPKRLRPRRSQSENKTRTTTKPTIGKEQDESLESSSVLGPLESSSILAPFRVVGIKLQLDWKFLRDQCAAGIFGGSTTKTERNEPDPRW